jgi:hypothetical protein
MAIKSGEAECTSPGHRLIGGQVQDIGPASSAEKVVQLTTEFHH